MGLKIIHDPAEPREAGDAAAPEPRGVANPRIVDLITADRERGEVVLKILEPRPWGSDPHQLHQLEDKLNSYFSYVLDGFLAEQYPQYQGLAVRIQLDCAGEPRVEEQDFLLAATGFSARHGIRFVVEVVDDPLGGKAPWER
jgi:hypothetical protein